MNNRVFVKFPIYLLLVLVYLLVLGNKKKFKPKNNIRVVGICFGVVIKLDTTN